MRLAAFTLLFLNWNRVAYDSLDCMQVDHYSEMPLNVCFHVMPIVVKAIVEWALAVNETIACHLMSSYSDQQKHSRCRWWWSCAVLHHGNLNSLTSPMVVDCCKPHRPFLDYLRLSSALNADTLDWNGQHGHCQHHHSHRRRHCQYFARALSDLSMTMNSMTAQRMSSIDSYCSKWDRAQYLVWTFVISEMIYSHWQWVCLCWDTLNSIWSIVSCPHAADDIVLGLTLADDSIDAFDDKNLFNRSKQTKCINKKMSVKKSQIFSHTFILCW